MSKPKSRYMYVALMNCCKCRQDFHAEYRNRPNKNMTASCTHCGAATPLLQRIKLFKTLARRRKK